MVTEFAEIDIIAGKEQIFADGVASCKAEFLEFSGCHGLELHRSIENPQHFVLNIQWDDIAAHLAFRETPAFAKWRDLVGPCFAGAPSVWHSEIIGG